MAASDVVLAMLRGYVSKTRQVQIRLPQFVDFVKQYAERYQHRHSSLRMFVENTTSMLSPVLIELAEGGRCTLEFDGSDIELIVFNQYLVEKIRASYLEIDRDPDFPFPNEESLQVMVPPSAVTVNIKSDFVKWLSARPREPQVLRLTFPEDIPNMLVTSDLLERKLLDYSVMKIRSYLATGTNSSFMLQRLKEIFTLKDQVLQSMLREITTRTAQAIENLLNATEFAFTFWAHLASAILKEFRNKTEKLPQEHGYCQACYLVGLYNVYFKGLAQRDHDIEAALKSTEKSLQAEPYYFTISDVYSLRDEKGVPLTKRCPRDRIDDFLEKKTHSSSKEFLPEIIRLRTQDKREFLIHKSIILKLTLNKILAASREYKDYYTGIWYDNLGDFTKTPIMLHDDLFLEDLEARLQNDDPLLSALLSFDRLYLCRRERGDDEITRRIDGIFDLKRQALIALDEILGIKRRDMLTEARLRLPLWKTIPLFKHIFHLFDNVLGGGREKRRPRRQGSSSVKALSQHSTGSGRGASRSLVAQTRGRSGSNEPDISGPPVSAADQFGPYALPEEQELAGSSAEGTATARASDGRRESAKSTTAQRDQAARAETRPTKEPPAAGRVTAKQRAAAYRKAVEELAVRVIGSNQSIDERLKQLAVKWNPLFAEKAKRNLVEDVNSFVRDQVRILRRSLLRKPPDLERVQNLALRISDNEVFEEIKHKDEFREYITLYLIKVLGKV